MLHQRLFASLYLFFCVCCKLLPNVFHTNDMFALSEKSAEKKTKTGRLPIAHYKQKPAGSDLWPVNRCIPIVMCIWKHKMHQTISPSLQTSCFQLKRRFKNLAVGGFCQRNCLMKIKKYILFDNEIFQYNFSFIIILWWFWYFCWHFSWSFYVQCIIQVFIMYVLMHLMFS